MLEGTRSDIRFYTVRANSSGCGTGGLGAVVRGRVTWVVTQRASSASGGRTSRLYAYRVKFKYILCNLVARCHITAASNTADYIIEYFKHDLLCFYITVHVYRLSQKSYYYDVTQQVSDVIVRTVAWRL